jgi:hypothetical protein
MQANFRRMNRSDPSSSIPDLREKGSARGGGRPSPGDADLAHRACPACGDEGRGNVVVRAAVPAEPLQPEERARYWRGFRSRSCFFDYARCPRCGLLYCPTYFTDGALDRLYSSMPDNTAGAPPEVLRCTQEGYMGFLAEQRPLRGTYLEIGPDIGLATEAACVSGAFERVHLVEPNATVHDQLRVASGSIPTEVVADLDDLSETTRADIAVLIHVLDHLVDPIDYLRSLRQHLTDGAAVLIVVHNEASLLRRALGVRWPPFTLQHPQLFSPTTLRAMLSAAGFGVVALQPTVNVFPARHVVKTAASLAGIDGRWATSVPTWRIRLRLGNIMAVATA